MINFSSFKRVCCVGPAPNDAQDSFMYCRQNGFLLVMLDDDNCDRYTSLSMGHGMCGNDLLSTCGPRGRFGVEEDSELTCCMTHTVTHLTLSMVFHFTSKVRDISYS